MIVLDPSSSSDDPSWNKIAPTSPPTHRLNDALLSYPSTPLQRPRSPSLDPPPAYYPGAPQRKHTPEPAGRRFVKAFLLALLIYTLLCVAVRALVHFANRHVPRRGDRRPVPHVPSPEGTFHIDYCAERHDWTMGRGGSSGLETASLTYTLPPSTDDLFFIAKGVPSSGRVHVKPVAEEEGGEVQVDVRLLFASTDVIEQAQIYRIARGENGHGVGLFLFSPSSESILGVDMTIRIPTNPFGLLRTFSTLDIAALSYAISLADLASSIHFQKASLVTSNAPIGSKGLNAGTTIARTTRREIRGRFAVDGALDLRTTGAEIAAEVVATNGAGGTPPTMITLATENAPIYANVSLASSAVSRGKGIFQVSARTTHAPSALVFSSSPIDSTLRLRSSTSDHPALVRLHPAYEGTFTLRSSGATPELVYSRAEADPAGQGRDRVVEVGEMKRGFLGGWTEWVESKVMVWAGNARERGEIEVETTNSPARLEL
ncbi:hypothetical protein OF83DRAFT_1148206 [Amylostereum chailletii]|nr:hypothetical protein OF83DRAFT_1148206 [Amylostereum chailletii]